MDVFRIFFDRELRLKWKRIPSVLGVLKQSHDRMISVWDQAVCFYNYHLPILQEDIHIKQ